MRERVSSTKPSPPNGPAIGAHTSVKMTLKQMWSAILVIVVLVGGALGVWWTMRAHANEDSIHLGKKFREEHGPPVGERDLERAVYKQTSTVSGLKTSVEAALAELKEAHQALGLDVKKCRRKGNNIICPVSR